MSEAQRHGIEVAITRGLPTLIVIGARDPYSAEVRGELLARESLPMRRVTVNVTARPLPAARIVADRIQEVFAAELRGMPTSAREAQFVRAGQSPTVKAHFALIDAAQRESEIDERTEARIEAEADLDLLRAEGEGMVSC